MKTLVRKKQMYNMYCISIKKNNVLKTTRLKKIYYKSKFVIYI